MGSKSRISKHIVPIIQRYITENNIITYYEPFVGGANVIDKIVCDNKIGSDYNKYLVALLNRMKSGEPLYESVSKELYDKARTAWRKNDSSEFEDWQIGNIGFVASYNGRWFDGGYAKPGYDKNRYRDYYQESLSNVNKQKANPLFSNCTFIHMDYKDLDVSRALIYCDPPYRDSLGYRITDFDYEMFYERIRKMSKKNTVLVSEYSMPDDFTCIWSKEVKCLIDSNRQKQDYSNNRTEKLFIYNI